jgi:molecular chaperone IbpA
LADHVKVASASLENGLLSIDLAREIPEQLKPRRIDISEPPRARPATSKIEQDTGRARKTA